MPFFILFMLSLVIVYPIITFVMLDSSKGNWVATFLSFAWLIILYIFIDNFTSYVISYAQTQSLLTQESCEPCYETCHQSDESEIDYVG